MPDWTDITTLQILIVSVLAYLLGSVPFGIVSAKLFSLGDLRQIGSGNIGATNVLRTGNKPAAALTLIGDAGKGAFAVFVAHTIVGQTGAQIAGLFAFLGHCFPIWLNFKGGKGVATFLGTVLALSFPVGISACLTWLLTAIVFRISSLAALICSAAVPVWMYFFNNTQFVAVSILLAILIWVRHHTNINRIINSQEPKIGKKG